MYGLIILTFVIVIVVILLVQNSESQRKATRSPEAIMNRALGSASIPPASIVQYDHEQAVEWAKEIIAQPEKVAIIDTETTGIDAKSEIVEIAVIDGLGEVLMHTLVKPSKRIRWPKAESFHGISPATVATAPTFETIRSQLAAIISDRQTIAYNARFDGRLIAQSAHAANCEGIQINVGCAMAMYALFKGEWDEKNNHYKWHKLKNTKHRAHGDCLAALNLIKEMASAD